MARNRPMKSENFIAKTNLNFDMIWSHISLGKISNDLWTKLIFASNFLILENTISQNVKYKNFYKPLKLYFFLKKFLFKCSVSLVLAPSSVNDAYHLYEQLICIFDTHLLPSKGDNSILEPPIQTGFQKDFHISVLLSSKSHVILNSSIFIHGFTDGLV